MDYQEAIKTLQAMYDLSDHPMSEISMEEAEAINIAISAMQELQEYRKLGTLEEVREAVERQKAKNPKNVGTEGYRYADTYRCPTCGNNFSGTGIANYCYHCGQRLDADFCGETERSNT